MSTIKVLSTFLKLVACDWFSNGYGLSWIMISMSLIFLQNFNKKYFHIQYFAYIFLFLLNKIDYPLTQLVKFGYNQNIKVKNFKHPLILSTTYWNLM